MVVEVHRHHHTSIKIYLPCPIQRFMFTPVLRWLLVMVLWFIIAHWIQNVCIWILFAGLCGILFPNKRESAFASLRMYESIGFTISAAYAQFLCMDVKMYITGCVLLVSVIGYFIMESIHEQEKRLKKKPVSFVWRNSNKWRMAKLWRHNQTAFTLAESDADTDDDVEIAKGLACCE